MAESVTKIEKEVKKHAVWKCDYCNHVSNLYKKYHEHHQLYPEVKSSCFFVISSVGLIRVLIVTLMMNVSYASVVEKASVSSIHFKTICWFTGKLEVYFSVTDVGKNLNQKQAVIVIAVTTPKLCTSAVCVGNA